MHRFCGYCWHYKPNRIIEIYFNHIWYQSNIVRILFVHMTFLSMHKTRSLTIPHLPTHSFQLFSIYKCAWKYIHISSSPLRALHTSCCLLLLFARQISMHGHCRIHVIIVPLVFFIKYLVKVVVILFLVGRRTFWNGEVCECACASACCPFVAHCSMPINIDIIMWFSMFQICIHIYRIFREPPLIAKSAMYACVASSLVRVN